MVDITGGVPTVSIPRLATGASVAAGNENSAVSETDPTSAAAVSAVGTVSGMVDLSYQLQDFGRPAADEAIMDDLGRAYGSALDAQLISGAGSGGASKGLLNWAAILSVFGSVASAEAFGESIWKGYSQAASASGFATPTRTTTSPFWRRAGWPGPAAAPAQQTFPPPRLCCRARLWPAVACL
jgi:HK97 family phage major capsid protein